jgi:hypothetical protein
MCFAAASNASRGWFGLTCHAAAVPGMIWAIPCAPAEDEMCGVKWLSWLIWREK